MIFRILFDDNCIADHQRKSFDQNACSHKSTSGMLGNFIISADDETPDIFCDIRQGRPFAILNVDLL